MKEIGSGLTVVQFGVTDIGALWEKYGEEHVPRCIAAYGPHGLRSVRAGVWRSPTGEEGVVGSLQFAQNSQELASLMQSEVGREMAADADRLPGQSAVYLSSCYEWLPE
jgi:hypothetical protein